jgi:hypothetical protein
VPSEISQEQFSNEAAIIHVEPFAGRNERAEIAPLRLEHGRKKEMDVKSGQLTCVVATAFGLGGEPLFP